VTEQRQLEAQLLQSQKMEAVGRLAGGVAHDFNNLLTVIMSYSDLLLEDLPSADTHREDVEQIRKAAEGAASLTRQLLAFSRQQVLDPKLVDPNEILRDVAKILRRVLGEDIELKLALDSELGRVIADRGQIEQVLMNLVVNARDAMPRGGKLTIETANVDLDETYGGGHIGVKPGQYVMLAVSDSGVGMDKATQARVFEPFFTTKEYGKGTGLGLSTVFGIVKQSGGSVWLYSEPGAGATFKIYLPRAEGVAEIGRPPAVPTQSLRGIETILLAEDEEQVRTVLVSILRMMGYQVLEARTPAEALKIAETHPKRIDLLLTDVVMPGMNGRELAERVLTMREGLRVLFMSGYTDDVILHHGVLEAGVPFLQKPITPDSLTRKVRQVLDADRVG
jgi:nitrogen-specific signal transduction histidine kinase/ActR/RegA family two-component response regulator